MSVTVPDTLPLELAHEAVTERTTITPAAIISKTSRRWSAGAKRCRVRRWSAQNMNSVGKSIKLGQEVAVRQPTTIDYPRARACRCNSVASDADSSIRRYPDKNVKRS